MESEESFREKQMLLQKEIIDKNYDKTSFINYCLSKKENGDDLNNWTIEELTEVVKEFSKNQEENQPKNQQQTTNEEEINQENVEKMEKFNAEEHKNFKEKVITCRKLEKTQLNNNDITITVKNPKEVEGGVFGKNYVVYEVQTEPFGWVVERRYNDFDWLRKLLAKYFPSYNVPPLPDKKMGNKRFEQKFILKRMKFLNLFINNVVKSETFKASEILLSFLSYEDRSKFDSKFKEYTSKTPSSYVEEYRTLEGKLTISLDEGNEKYFTNIEKYFRLQGQILDKVNYNLKVFHHNMTIVCEQLKVIQKNFEVLHVLNTRVMMKPTITKTYEEIGCFFKNFGRVLIKQKDLIKNQIKDFFKYVNYEGKAYSELIVRREELKSMYIAENQRVTQKKEKVFATGDITKMEINVDDRNIDKERLLKDKPYAFEHICLNDSRSLEKIYNQLGYANKMNMQELRKMIKEYCVRFVDNVKSFDAEFYPTINDLVSTWSNMETFVMTATTTPTAK